MTTNSAPSSTSAMGRWNSFSVVFLCLIFAIFLVRETLSNTDIRHTMRRDYEADPSSGDGEIHVAHSGSLGTMNSAEDPLPGNETEIGEEDQHQRQDDLSSFATQETPSPKVAVAKDGEIPSQETDEQENIDPSDHVGASTSAATETVEPRNNSAAVGITDSGPSHKVIIWDGNVDVGTADPDQASPGVYEPKHPPSQERHSNGDSESGKKSKEGGGPGKEGHPDRSTNDQQVIDGSSENFDKSKHIDNPRPVDKSSSPGVARSSTWLIVLAAVGSSLFLSGMNHLISAIEQYSCRFNKRCHRGDFSTNRLRLLSPDGCNSASQQLIILPFHLN